jgi:hypothetical protein
MSFFARSILQSEADGAERLGSGGRQEGYSEPLIFVEEWLLGFRVILGRYTYRGMAVRAQ